MTEKKKEEFKEVVNDFVFWNPEVGDDIVGTVVDYFNGQYGQQAIIETSDDERFTMPNHTMLNSLMTKVNIGDIVKVHYVEDKPSDKAGRSPLKVYKLYIKN